MSTSPPTVKVGIALILAASGMAVLIHLYPEKLKAPAWVAFFALALLRLAGACIIAQAFRLQGLARWMVCGLLGGMAVVPAWIAFGTGSRRCTAVAFGARSAVSEMVCRGSFGIGAVVLAITFAFAVRGAFRSRDTS